MKRTIIITLLMILLVLSLVSAHGEETFSQAEEIIEQKISCDDLSDDQLEALGDYYMEQMHPGETHETMDNMMGGEGSESLKQMHINMARSFYCGEHGAMSSGMMDMMMGRTMMGGGMMNEGMMGSSDTEFFSRGGGNMMNVIWPFGFMGMGFGLLFMILFWGVVIWLIVWLIRQYAQPKKGKRRESAQDILKKRYARGDITKKQFDQMKKELK